MSKETDIIAETTAILRDPDIRDNPEIRTVRDFQIQVDKKHFALHPDSPTFLFYKELRDIGFDVECRFDVLDLLPEHKDQVLPLAIKYYMIAKEQDLDNCQNAFISFFKIKKDLSDYVPFLISEFTSAKTSLLRYNIAEALLFIKSKKYAEEYVKLLEFRDYGKDLIPIIELVGKLKIQSAVPGLLSYIDDNYMGCRVIRALSCYNSEEFRPYFEKYAESPLSSMKDESVKALNKLNKKKLK